MKTPRAVEPLLQTLNDKTNTVRQRAVAALGRIKDPETIPVLIRVVLENRCSNVSEAAYQALRKFGCKAGPAVLKALEEHPDIYLIDLLARIKVDGRMERLIALVGHSRMQIRQKAISALGKTNDPATIEFLIDLLDRSDGRIQSLPSNHWESLERRRRSPKCWGCSGGTRCTGQVPAGITLSQRLSSN